jgi:murein DD-endopeptidase MepM/ murein hydrolase activator NlpD
VTIPELDALISNPFAPPRLGSDDPHQGVDFSDIDPVYQITLTGRPIHAVLPGIIAGVIQDRFPYGNAIIIETPLKHFSDDGITALNLPTPAPTQQGHPALTCPERETQPTWDFENRSLYLIYAHLEDPPTHQLGENIICGQALNAIGSSGNALNPHLHLELRVGPAGARFEGLAHYTPSASPIEMHNYCQWRVSETFQLLDPMFLFQSMTPSNQETNE